jgi:hypothetical protein
MPRRKLVDEADARPHLAAAVASESALSSYARANGIDGRSLNAWQINWSQRAPTPTMVDFVELVPAAAPARPPLTLRVCRGECTAITRTPRSRSATRRSSRSATPRSPTTCLTGAGRRAR